MQFNPCLRVVILPFPLKILSLEKPRSPLKPGKFIKMTVKDEGIGIPDKYLSKIFDPYFTTKKEGSGMGLAISNEIIRQHGGYIDIESTVGEGSVFYIYLPAVTEKLSHQNQHVKNLLLITFTRVMVDSS